MGVLGLWKLLEPCGKPVPLESLEDKVLAVDVSIWLNQVLKGYRDGQNGTLPNAHLVGVFHRVCKLLAYRIKPVFVFDGGVPSLKQQTLSARRLKKAAASQAADRTSQKLVQNMLRQEAMRAVLGAAAPLPLAVGAAGRPDPFVLPPLPPEEPEADGDSESGSSDSEPDVIVDRLQHDLHSFDFESDEFRSLAPQVKHDILSDLKDTRKQNSWGKLDQMPKDADNFSDFQMERLRKRKKFQDSMDDVEAEITKRNTELLHMGIDLPGTVTAHSMASKAGTFLLLSQPSTEKRFIGDAAGGSCGTDATCGVTAGAGAAAAAPAAVKIKAEPREGEEDEAALVEAADVMEYLAGTDLFGGGGSSGGGSAARVDQRIDELRRTRSGPGGRGGAAGRSAGRSVADAEADTAQVFSEMGKKYSNLYLKFSAQWLEDEKKADVKVKRDSPQKRKAPEPAAKDVPPTKRSASKPSFSDVPTLEELTRDLAKISDARKKKSRSGQFKKPSTPVSRPSSKPPKSAPARPTGTGSGAAAGAVASSSGTLTVSIDPVRLPAADDLFGDVFSSSAAEDNVGLMSDSDESGEDVLKEVPEDTSEGALKNTSKPDSKHSPRDAGKFIPKEAAKDANKDSPKSAPRRALKDAPKSAVGAVTEVEGGGPAGGMAGRGASETGGGTARTGTKAGTGSSKGQLSENDLRATALGDTGVGADQSGVKMELSTSDLSDKTSERRRPIAELGTGPGDDKSDIASDAELSHDEAVATEDRTVSSAGPSPARSKPHVSFRAASGAVSDEDLDDPEGPPPVSDGRGMSLDMPVSPRRSDRAASETAASSAASANASTSAAESEPALPDSVWDGMDDVELRDLAEELASEQMALLEERGRQQRDAAGVSDDMYRDVQALLEQFGIPYVVSPKEAEAQCAFLEIAGLTEGTITDDSDIWLFGGRRVYKNFFNQKKFVECYRAGDIQGSLGLTRGQLVCVALLTGSDYTLGVESVGCVRALEILAEFPGEGLSGLRAFRRWWDECRAGAAAVRTPIRRSLASLKLSQGFPAEAVMTAYLEPEVDTSREPFSWAAPDLDGLKHLAAAKFGWGGQHTDNVLRPVLDRFKQKHAQRRLDAFFSAAHSQQAPAEGSRRLQEAVRRVRGDDPPPPTAGGALGSAVPATGEEESLEGLMDDGLDELLAAVEETDGDGDNDKRGGDVDGDLDGGLDEADGLDALEDADDFSAMEEQEAPLAESSPLPDIVPQPGVAPRAAASGSGSRGRGGARGRGRGRARARKPTAIFTDDGPRPSAPASSRSAASPRRQPDTAKRSASVPAELADLDPVARERLLLVRRLKDRANLIRSQIQHELPQSRPAVKRPSTRQVRARMMDTLLKQNPRLRLEREAQLRRRLGLPVNPVGRGRSCRDPGARRAESFSEALTEADERRQPVETGTEGSVAPAPATAAVEAETAAAAAAPEPQCGAAPGPATTAAVESQTGSVTDSGSSPAAAVSSVQPRPAAAAGRRRPPPGPPSAARRQSAADRLRQAAAAPDRPMPVLPAPAAAEEAPQRQLSERRQAEARRHAGELLRAAGGTARGRRRAQRATGRRQRPAPQPRPGPLRAGGLSESSDSD